MKLQSLRYFKVLSEIQHFNNAATKMHISQPSLSYAIAELEKDLGAPLFDRKGKKVNLNQNGELFLTYVDEALKLLDEGYNTIKQLTAPKTVINVSCIHSVSLSAVPILMEKFYADQNNASIKFSFSEGLNEEIKHNLYNEKVDLIFCVEKPDNAIAYPVFEQELFLIVPLSSPFASRTEVDLREIANEPFIMISKDSAIRKTIENEFRALKMVPNTVFEVSQCNSALTYVAMNFGVSIVPSIPNINRSDIKVLRISSPHITRKIYVAWLDKKNATPEMKKVQEFIMEHTMKDK